VGKTLALVGTLMALVATNAAAQDRDRKYEVGIRSALITGTMNLSDVDPAFANLRNDGAAGAHMSGFFLMFNIRPHLRIGVETLVSNSDMTAATTMNYQAAGPVVELTYGTRWFVSGGVHGGGLIVNAMARQGAEPAEGASTGSFFKGDGAFLAPYADVGYRFRRGEVGMFVKQVNIFGQEDRGGIGGFSSSFVGVRFALGL
jgi:hypothetical protein